MPDETKLSILIVDDERANLHTLFHTLSTQYNVIAANSGKVAIQKACESVPDLILLDILMPEMTGYEVLSQLKEMSETCNIPVIFITGLTSPEDETKGLLLGAADYISKPFNLDIVRARVKTQLQIVELTRKIEKLEGRR